MWNVGTLDFALEGHLIFETWGTCLWQAKTSGVRSTLLALETFYFLNFENEILNWQFFCISPLWKMLSSTYVHHLYALHALRTLSNEIKWVLDHIFKIQCLIETNCIFKNIQLNFIWALHIITLGKITISWTIKYLQKTQIIWRRRVWSIFL